MDCASVGKNSYPLFYGLKWKNSGRAQQRDSVPKSQAITVTATIWRKDLCGCNQVKGVEMSSSWKIYVT